MRGWSRGPPCLGVASLRAAAVSSGGQNAYYNHMASSSGGFHSLTTCFARQMKPRKLAFSFSLVLAERRQAVFWRRQKRKETCKCAGSDPYKAAFTQGTHLAALMVFGGRPRTDDSESSGLDSSIETAKSSVSSISDVMERGKPSKQTTLKEATPPFLTHGLPLLTVGESIISSCDRRRLGQGY
ncbi:hypothetical protein E2C01_031360 [Portunus trituberculatus]|uniref:Uncharacterized protein n=1 Tax=Portunus trituberculatus TaxID=210409 RepID=A0A5B7EWM1_PORTR|nr:hypothetical protein [Portunus trituberculatus]